MKATMKKSTKVITMLLAILMVGIFAISCAVQAAPEAPATLEVIEETPVAIETPAEAPTSEPTETPVPTPPTFELTLSNIAEDVVVPVQLEKADLTAVVAELSATEDATAPETGDTIDEATLDVEAEVVLPVFPIVEKTISEDETNTSTEDIDYAVYTEPDMELDIYCYTQADEDGNDKTLYAAHGAIFETGVSAGGEAYSELLPDTTGFYPVEVTATEVKALSDKALVFESEPETANVENTEETKPVAKETGTIGNGTSSNGSSAGGSSTGGGQTGGASATPTTDPNVGKQWCGPIYEDVWVVDVPASTREEDVTELVELQICGNCQQDITGFAWEHIYDAVLAHGNSCNGYSIPPNNGMSCGHKICGNWYSGFENRVVGTRTVTVPEKGHWETKLVRPAGYY